MKIRSLCAAVITTMVLAQPVFPAMKVVADTIDKNIKSSETQEREAERISDQASINEDSQKNSAIKQIQTKANRYKIIQYYTPFVELGSQIDLSNFFRVYDTQTGFYPEASFTFEGTVDRNKKGVYPVTAKTSIGGESLSLSAWVTVFEKTGSGGGGGTNPTANYRLSGPEQVTLFAGQSFSASDYFSVYKNDVMDNENTKKITYTGNYYAGAPAGIYSGKVSVTVNGNVLTKDVKITVKNSNYDEFIKQYYKVFENGKLLDSATLGDIVSLHTQFTNIITQIPTGIAQTLWDIVQEGYTQYYVREATKSIDGLFENNTFGNAIKESLNSESIESANVLLNKVTNANKKTELQKKIDNANEQLKNVEGAREAINDFFENELIISGKLVLENIEAAEKLVNNLVDGQIKTTLQQKIDLLYKAYNDLKNPLQDAKDATNALFGDDTHTILAGGVTQESIDNAKNMIDALDESDDKTQLLNDVKKAQELLDSQNQAALDKAKAAVDALFADASYTKLGEDATQEMIDQASALVNALPESEQKTQWLADIANAQKLLDEKLKEEEATIEKAKQAVDALFKDKDHTILDDGIAQKNIDEAAGLVNKLADGDLKEQLLKDIALADKLLNGETAITTNSFVIGKSKYVEGTISGNKITKIALEVNGVMKKQIFASKGNYKYWALDQIIDAKDKVFVIGYDSKGVQISKEPVEVVAASEEIGLDTNLFTIGKDNYVYGSYTGDVAKVALRIDGKLTQKISVKDGEFKYYAKDKITNVNLNVELVAFNAANQIVSFKTVKVTDALATMSLNNYRIGEGYVTGTYTGDAKFMTLIVNGIAKQTIGVSNGQIKYYAKDKIISTTDKVEVALLDGNKTEVKRASLLIPTTLGSLQLNDYKLNAAYLEGSYTGDVVRIRVVVNGVTKQTIPVSKEIFKYYARNIINSSTDKVIVEALDSANNVLDSKVVNITK